MHWDYSGSSLESFNHQIQVNRYFTLCFYCQLITATSPATFHRHYQHRPSIPTLHTLSPRSNHIVPQADMSDSNLSIPIICFLHQLYLFLSLFLCADVLSVLSTFSCSYICHSYCHCHHFLLLFNFAFFLRVDWWVGIFSLPHISARFVCVITTLVKSRKKEVWCRHL